MLSSVRFPRGQISYTQANLEIQKRLLASWEELLDVYKKMDRTSAQILYAEIQVAKYSDRVRSLQNILSRPRTITAVNAVTCYVML